MKSFFLGDFLYILTVSTVWKIGDGNRCGQPGSFVNVGRQQIKNDNQTVFYHCTYKGILFGNNKRDCQENGVWSGTIPLCILPTSKFIRAVNQSSRHDVQKKETNASECLTNDLQIEPCIYLNASDKEKSVTIDFDRPYSVLAVRLILSPKDLYTTTIVNVFENLTDSTVADGVRCDRDTVELEAYRCSRSIRAVSMRIRFNSTLPSFVGVNEVYIYEERNEPAQCPTPDQPEFGIIENGTDDRMTLYRCLVNYILVGSNRSICLPNGTWSKPAPICRKNKSCYPFEDVSNISGKWTTEKTNQGLRRSTLKCDEGFQVFGSPSTVECPDENGGWSQTNATCRKSPETVSGGNKMKSDTQLSGKENGNTGIRNEQPNETSPIDVKLIVVGTVSGVISSILVVSIVLAIIFGRKRCIRSVGPPNDLRRDSSYYHYYNGINYEDMLSETSSCSTSRHQSERAPAKDPRVPDILELVYENPELYNQGVSRNGSTVEAEANEPSKHIYSEVEEALIYDELDQIPSTSRGSESSDVFLENEIYGEEEEK